MAQDIHDLRARAHQLIAEGHRLLAEAERLAAGGHPLVYDQDHLPPGARSRGSYLERHRGHIALATPGWSAVGKIRRVTAEAWEAEVEAETTTARAARTSAVTPDNDVRADNELELDRKLGIRPVRRGAR
jgi:hypothetical protein